MPRSFPENKDEVLLETYRFIRVSDGQVWMSASEIEPNCHHSLSKSFIEVILKSLSKGNLLEEEEQNDETFYTLTDKGIAAAEKIIDQKALWEEFDNITTSVNEIVDLDKDSPELSEIKSGLDALDKALEQGNDVGGMSEEEIASARAEVSALKVMFSGIKVRAGAAATQARQTLGWIMKKAAGTIVAELSKKVLGAVLLLLGYGG